MISAVAWVPRGAARAQPKTSEPSKEELEQAAAAEEEEEDTGDDEIDDDDDDDDDEGDEDSSMDGEEDLDSVQSRARAAAKALLAGSGEGKDGAAAGAAAVSGGIEDALRKLGMEHYDTSEDEDGGGGGGSRAGKKSSLIQRQLYGRSDLHKGEDPYMRADTGEESEEEQEDLRIDPTDLVILTARHEDDVNTLEVWVYQEAELLNGDANVYVHHELMLPNFPLCLAWIDCDPRAPGDASVRGNLVAVGSLDPGIEIWDLDTLDVVEPAATLGGFDKAVVQAHLAEAKAEGSKEGLNKNHKKELKTKVKKKTKAIKPAYLPGSHKGGVLGLSWNQSYRNVLASAGEDHTVKVWDVVQGQVVHTWAHHQDKVQAVAWNRQEAHVLLTGSFDKTATLVDVRSPSATPARWALPADTEALGWCPHDLTCFLVSCENGEVVCLDARKGAGGTPLWRLAAHDRPTCALSWCTTARGLLATGSTDKVAKLWDVSEGRPVLVASQDLQVGAVFTLAFCADAPHLLAVGGAGGSVSVWDVRAATGVAERFPTLTPQAAAAAEDSG